jgi:hypothetical protein
MLIATLKALTWGTVATAVISAVLLAAGGGSMLRAESATEARVSRPKAIPVGGNSSTQTAPSVPANRTASPH